MFQSISHYLSLIGEYTNPAAIIYSAIGKAVVAFLLSGLLIILLRKFIFVKRRHVILKVLAITYAVIIPILAGLFGLKLGLVNGIHHDLKDHLGAYTKGLDAAFSEEIREELGDTDLSKASVKDWVDTVSVAIYNVYRHTLEYKSRDVKPDLSSRVSVFLLDLFSAKGISVGLKKGITKLVEKSIGVDEDITSEAMEIRLGELLKSGLLAKLVGMQIDKFFNGIKTGIYLVFFLILLIPGIEVAIAVYLNKKAVEKPASGI